MIHIQNSGMVRSVNYPTMVTLFVTPSFWSKNRLLCRGYRFFSKMKLKCENPVHKDGNGVKRWWARRPRSLSGFGVGCAIGVRSSEWGWWGTLVRVPPMGSKHCQPCHVLHKMFQSHQHERTPVPATILKKTLVWNLTHCCSPAHIMSLKFIWSKLNVTNLSCVRTTVNTSYLYVTMCGTRDYLNSLEITSEYHYITSCSICLQTHQR